ncbi:MAG: hypothetical protein EPO07_14725 [Verrucomicrobia bacterium]|nr:MAG: hypothetical protein EPO07_14725 [Verrucomicrobiota bacterium]
MSNSSFAAQITRYKSSGADSLKSELPGLLEQATKPDASTSLRYFVADLSLDLQLFDQALRMLTLIEQGQQESGLSDVHYNLVGFSKWELNDEAGAIEAYKHSLAINPSNVSSLRGLCLLLNGKGRDKEALPYAKRWRGIVPEDPEAVEWSSVIEENCR